MQQVPTKLQVGLEPTTIMVVIISVEVMVIVDEDRTIKEAAIIISIIVEEVLIIIQIVEGLIIIVGEGATIEIKAIGWEEHTILILSLPANPLLK